MRNVIPAPQWLMDRMEALRKLPPPTLEEVRICFEASANHCAEHRFDEVNTQIKRDGYLK